jgi:class 3 adenylate cyclase
MTGRPPADHAPLLGRAAASQRLGAWAADAAGGEPRVVLLSGEAGAGKTRLIDVTLEALPQQTGMSVVSTTCDDELGVPGRPLARLLAGFDGHDRMFSWYDEDRASMPGRSSSSVIIDDFLATVLEAASRGPLALAVDDMHWADEVTAAAVRELAATLAHGRRAGRLSVLLLCAFRPVVGDSHASRLLAGLRREPIHRAVQLPPLREEEVAHLVSLSAGEAPSRRLTDDLMAMTRGNPLLVHAAIRCAFADGPPLARSMETLPVGELTVEADLTGRLAKMQSITADLLADLALLGEDRSVDDIAAGCEPEEDQLIEALDELIDLDIIREHADRYRFSHPLLRQLVIGHEPALKRRRRHRRIAARLSSAVASGARATPSADRVIEIAHHLELAGTGVPSAEVVPAAVAASVVAFRVGAWGQSARFAELAIGRLSDDLDHDVDRAELWTRAALAHFRNADSAAADHRFVEAIDLAQRADNLALWGECVLWLARSQTMLESEDAPRLLDEGPVASFMSTAADQLPELRALLHEMVAEIRFSRGDFDGGLEASRQGRLAARGTADADVATVLAFGEGLNHLGRLELIEAQQRFEDSARHSRMVADRWRRPWGPGRLAIVALMRSEPTVAHQHAEIAEEEAALTASWGERALAVTLAAAAGARAGDFARADGRESEARLLHERSQFVFVPSILYPNTAWAHAIRGDLTGALTALDRAETLGVTGLWRLRVAVAALCGQPGRSSDRGYRIPRGRPTAFTLSAWVSILDAADLDGANDIVASASPLLDELVEADVLGCPDWGVSVARLAAVAAWRDGRPEEADARLRAIVTDLGTSGAVVEAARACFDRARLGVTLAPGESDTRIVLGEAAAEFERLGLFPFVRRAHGFAVEHATALWPGGPIELPHTTWVLLRSDIVNSTALNVRAGDAIFYELMRDHDRVVRDALNAHEGTEFRHHGDGIAAWFADAHHAVACALEMNRAVAALTGRWVELPVQLRIGIVAGDVTIGGGDLHGLTIIRSVRVCAAAEPGQIIVTREVAEQLSSRPQAWAYDRLGPHELKHLPEPEELFGIRAH